MAQRSEASLLMTEGSIARKLVRFALPVFWGNLFQQLYNVVDSLVVGNLLGSEALAAVGSSGSLIFLLVGLFYGTFSGAGVVVSRFFGARDNENVSKAVHTTVTIGLLCGVAVTILGSLLAPQILVWMGTPENVLPNSLAYVRVYFGGVLTVVMYNTVSGIMQAVGDSRHPLYYLLTSSIVNVVLDILFVGPLHMGIAGAAWATVIAQATSAMLGLYRLTKVQASYRLELRKLRIHLETPAKMEKQVDAFQFSGALQEIWKLIGECNKYIDVTQPWVLGREEVHRMMMLFDSHCHVDEPKFDEDRDEVLARMAANGVTRYAVVGSDMVGEIGLDYFYDLSPRDVQKNVCTAQLNLAYELGAPVAFHIRDAHGSWESAKEYLNLGYYISFAGPVTFKKAPHLQQVAVNVPQDRLLIETDSPYLAPEPMRGRRNEPTNVRYVAEKIAALRGESVEEVAAYTYANACQVYRLEK